MPIAMTREEWQRIVKWTDAGQEAPEALRRRDYVKYLNEASRAMTKSWPNSLENVNKRNEEIRRARLDAAEQANSKFYRHYVVRQQEQQQRLMYSARDTIFKNKDAPKLLLSAVIETTVQKERAEQVKFNALLRGRADERRRREDEEVMRKAKEWHALNQLRARRRFEVNKEHQREIVEQAHECSERQRREREEEVNMQKIDNIMANKEIEALKQFDEEFKTEEKARIFKDMQRSRLEAEQRRREQASLDDLDRRLQDVLLQARARVERRRKLTEKQERDEKLRILDAISQKLESGDAAREAKEQAMLQRAVAEKTAKEEARRQAELQKQQKFRADRAASREQFLQDEARRVRDEHTMRQWELMNRFKNQEISEEFRENERQERSRKVREHKEELLRLKREREEREALERAEMRHFYGALALSKTRAADNKLLTHAAALVAEARDRGRPERALHRAIDRYCKMYRLYPMPELPASVQEHFRQYAPCDGSAPDAAYREPAAPPPDRGPDADYDDGGRKDGLQAVSKAAPKPKQEQKEEPADYKRKGAANGLQRAPDTERLSDEGDVRLPPIPVAPCKTADCACELKRQ